MRDIALVEAAYLVADAELARQEANASGAKDRLEIQLARFVNDSTYYVAVIGQFEDAIQRHARVLTQTRRSSGNWPDRAAWDVLDVDRLSRMILVGLLFEKGGSEYQEIKGYFDERDEAAHGQWLTKPVFLPGLIRRLIQLELMFPQ